MNEKISALAPARADGRGMTLDGGNMTNTDACTNTCKNAKCGDMVVQAGVEECDDGNMTDTDACTNICKNAKVRRHDRPDGRGGVPRRQHGRA